jgi:hypothetical protein
MWREKPPDAESAVGGRDPESAGKRPHLSGARGVRPVLGDKGRPFWKLELACNCSFVVCNMILHQKLKIKPLNESRFHLKNVHLFCSDALKTLGKPSPKWGKSIFMWGKVSSIRNAYSSRSGKGSERWGKPSPIWGEVCPTSPKGWAVWGMFSPGKRKINSTYYR